MKSIKFKMSSSKFFMAILILVMSNLLMWVPMIVNLVSGTTITLMTGSEYTSLMIGIFGIYCGLNVMQKQVFAKFGMSDPELADSSRKRSKEDPTAE